MAAVRDVQPGYPTTQPVRQIAGRPAHAAAHVEHMGRGADARLCREHIDRLEATEMILVVVLQSLLGQFFQLDAVGAQFL